MKLAGLLPAALADRALARTKELAFENHRQQADITAPPAMRPFVVAAMAEAAGLSPREATAAGLSPREATAAGLSPREATGHRVVLAVTATGREADDLADGLGCLLPPDSVAVFPSWETLPHERLSPRSDTVGRRLAVLRRLAHPGKEPLKVVIAPVRAVLQPQLKGLGDLEPIELSQGGTHDLDDIVQRLVDVAYARVDLVTKRGEFAVRGGILDVFPPTEEHPVRVELWGDEVEDARYFAAGTQRSLGEAEHGLWAPPCRELLLTDDVRARAQALSKEHPELVEMLDKLADGTPVEGMEALAPVLVDDLVLLVEELPAGAHVVVCDPERVRARAEELTRTSEEFLEASWAAAAGGGSAPVDLGAAAYRDVGTVRETATAAGIPWWEITPFAAGEDAENVVDARAHEPYVGDMEKLVADARDWARDGWRVVFVTEGHGPAERLAEVLREHDLGVRVEPDLAEPPAEGITVSNAVFDTGFVAPGLRLTVVTETDFAGQRSATKDMRRMPSRRTRE
jgi:transcription-repair coupling factor (superfamily II helicase)